MAKKNVDAEANKQPPAGPSLEESSLARILAEDAWTAEQAKQVLAAQGDSGLPLAQFAKRHGLTPERLYNWKRKLRPEPRSGPRPGDAEGEPDKRVSVQDVELDLLDPGERFMYDYVQRATQGAEPMWRLLGIGRTQKVLLCAVQWVGGDGSYSLVQLDLTQPALWWKDVPTAEAATQALDNRGRAGAQTDPGPRVAPLVRVQVPEPPQRPEAPFSPRPEPGAQDPCMSICLLSGVRIQIGPGVPEPLMRMVLRAVGAGPC
ncbi:MAG TPA: transposase [Burkholderiaceae bacterium]|nr:transposase [Burkholderiaceae bacterium]